MNASLWQRWKFWWISVGAGVLLGCIYRIALLGEGAEGLVMGIGFLAVVPIAMGFVSVTHYLRNTPREAIRWYVWLPLPWASVLIAMVVSLIFRWEGYACLIFAGPIMLVASLIGG
jgi:hypothetical protein